MMRETFWVSLCFEGIHGGGLFFSNDRMMFRTEKKLTPDKMKSLIFKYYDIEEAAACVTYRIIPSVAVRLKDGREYRFLAYANQKRIVGLINTKVSMQYKNAAIDDEAITD